MFMHMKPLYTAKKKKNPETIQSSLFVAYIYIFLLLNTNTTVCWMESTSTLNLFDNLFG